MKQPSELERAFATHWEIYFRLENQPVPELESEYQFDLKRKFKFDVALPAQKVAIELEGGTLNGGRHVRPQGYENDCIKYNLAAERGWIVLRFTSRMVKRDPHKMIAQIVRVLNMRGAKL